MKTTCCYKCYKTANWVLLYACPDCNTPGFIYEMYFCLVHWFQFSQLAPSHCQCGTPFERLTGKL